MTLCPKCSTPLNLNTDAGMFRCPKCGFHRPESLDEAEERLRSRGQRPAVALTHRGEVDLRARSLFESGQDDLWRGDPAAAIHDFEQALEIQPDFSDAHLWIAKTSMDAQVQRDHLEEIIAHDPGHVEALRMLLVLNGDLTPEQAERSRSPHEPEIKQIEGAVKTQTKALICPVCGGDLTVEGERVVCRFCGHTAPLDRTHHASDGAELLGAALLKRRAQPVKWVVGARILHCTRCGAERTLPAERLSTVCPFCGSTQVIEQDALDSIEQPDGLAPFVIGEQDAQDAIRERLRSVGERIAGLFDHNQIASARIEGLYLPFWVFDALAEISQTTFDHRTPNSRNALATIRPYENVKFQDGLNGVTVPAVQSPPPALIDQVGKFDVSAAVAYQPNLLAKHPAALYGVDFDNASLTAREKVSDHMRERYGKSDNRNVEVQVFTSVLQMSFTLLLLPVWVGTLTERDGDLRAALVNGQSGQVALGRAQKPD